MTAAPWIALCLPRGKTTIFINGICREIKSMCYFSTTCPGLLNNPTGAGSSYDVEQILAVRYLILMITGEVMGAGEEMAHH